MNMQTHTLTGHYRTDGGLLQPGKLIVIRNDSGMLVDEGGGWISAQRHAETDTTSSIDITSIEGVWHFVANESDCERIGLEIADEDGSYPDTDERCDELGFEQHLEDLGL